MSLPLHQLPRHQPEDKSRTRALLLSKSSRKREFRFRSSWRRKSGGPHPEATWRLFLPLTIGYPKDPVRLLQTAKLAHQIGTTSTDRQSLTRSAIQCVSSYPLSLLMKKGRNG